ncbi:hypothetical protein ACFXHA_34945 [Nocardia sp. NPDC059240]|uniref:hypothetical protein n=1 Tax=Nocardia sp. NPDC059240 TaxID=3346786 RepID=UPI0036B886F3
MKAKEFSVATGGAFEINRIEIDGNRAAILDVRCIEGTVRVGDRVIKGRTGNGDDVQVDLVIDGLLRYGRASEFVDPPHVARIRLSGQGIRDVMGFSVMHTS